MTLPARLIGYGAYNLCFDAWLGKPPGGGPIFYKYLRDNGWPVNLVKVICYRNSAKEGLPPNRRVTLYDRYGAINNGFIDNLSNVVDQARQFGFWVQVCIFHFQAINDASEAPDYLPTVLADLGTGTCDRLRKFFSPTEAAINAEQGKLVRRIGDRLRVYDNVLWELANEVRIPSNCGGSADSNCLLVDWLRKMRSELITSLQGRPYRITTSTGIQGQNEEITFKRQRPVGTCNAAALPAEFFDFHKGQWDGGGRPAVGIAAAKSRAIGANGYNPGGFLIINDDGAGFSIENEQQMIDHAKLIKQWACLAFANGLSFSSKQQYPPIGWDFPALNALKEANANQGCP